MPLALFLPTGFVADIFDPDKKYLLQLFLMRIGYIGTITINGTAKVTLKNVMASNGVIHVIDAVLMPADMATPEATAAATASS